MTETSGEIAVREGGTAQVIESDAVDGVVDVDVENHHVAVPPHFNVGYWDPDEDTASDGGSVVESRSSLHGFSLSKDQLDLMMAGGALATLAGGYLWSTTDGIPAMITAAVGIGLLALAYVSAYTHYQPNP